MKNNFKDPQVVQFLKSLNKKEIGMIKSIEKSSLRNMMAMPPEKLVLNFKGTSCSIIMWSLIAEKGAQQRLQLKGTTNCAENGIYDRTTIRP